MTEKKQVGAPRGNQNARKHGFYSRVLNEARKLQLVDAREVEGIDEEIAVVGVKLLALIDEPPDLLLDVDESQDINQDKYSREFPSMSSR